VSWRRPARAGDGDDLLNDLLAVVAGTRPETDAGLISRAYDVAAGVHAGQIRKSGDRYISHPVAVAAILAGTGADDQTLCAALLHDTLEGDRYSLAALRDAFGADVAALVTGVAGGGGAQAIADSRAVMIKLADRLHNLRTAAPLAPATRLSKSRDTLEVLVPLAATLGLDAIKAELEDLAAGLLSRDTLRTPASGRVLATAAALLPVTARSRWRDEWAGELASLPTRRQRAVFTARTLGGVPRLAVTLRRPTRAR
jgi:(p)ppGpp synthase/HD superfamily hydrolase